MGSAVGASAFDHVVDALHGEAFRQLDGGYLYGAHAEGAVALGAEEMDVLVVERAVVMSLACLVFGDARSVLDGMYEVVTE